MSTPNSAIGAALALFTIATLSTACAASTLRIEGRSDVDSCRSFAELMRPLMAAADKPILATSTPWLVFEEKLKQSGQYSTLDVLGKYGDAALANFEHEGHRLGFFMTACMNDVAPAEASSIAPYFAAMCSKKSPDDFGVACFVPAAAQLAKCMSAAKKANARAKCLRV